MGNGGSTHTSHGQAPRGAQPTSRRQAATAIQAKLPASNASDAAARKTAVAPASVAASAATAPRKLPVPSPEPAKSAPPTPTPLPQPSAVATAVQSNAFVPHPPPSATMASAPPHAPVLASNPTMTTGHMPGGHLLPGPGHVPPRGARSYASPAPSYPSASLVRPLPPPQPQPQPHPQQPAHVQAMPASRPVYAAAGSAKVQPLVAPIKTSANRILDADAAAAAPNRRMTLSDGIRSVSRQYSNATHSATHPAAHSATHAATHAATHSQTKPRLKIGIKQDHNAPNIQPIPPNYF